VAENTRAPVAIRIVRPYETEEELFANELETLGKTSVVLIGAHPRPTGVILRFEVTLANGETVLRGEGRVLAHKENAFRGQPGLSLRFTRLDPKSKSVVDRATALRESRAGGEPTPSRPSPPLADSPLADALTQSTPAPSATAARTSDDLRADPSAKANADQEAAVASARASAREKANATARANAKRTGTGRPSALTPPPVPVAAAAYEPEPEPEATQHSEPTPVTSIPGEVAPVSFAPHAHAELPSSPEPEPGPVPVPVRMQPAAAPGPAPAPAHVASSGERTPPAPTGPLAAPPDRAELLARLRERAGKLPADRVEAILTARR
jgi:hypothetical protein